MILKLIKNLSYFLQANISCKGKNNLINIPVNTKLKHFHVRINGNNNQIIVGKNAYLHNTKILMGFPDCPVSNCIVEIGSNTRINGALLQIGESESNITIGEDCMLSNQIELNCTDHHSICDGNDNCINKGKYISIGSHVWICRDVKVMKNTVIPSGCVIATGSIVTKENTQENCILAGIPARVVKKNIHWKRTRPEIVSK